MQIYDGRNDIKAAPTKHTVAVVSTNRIVCGENDQMTIRKNGRDKINSDKSKTKNGF